MNKEPCRYIVYSLNMQSNIFVRRFRAYNSRSLSRYLLTCFVILHPQAARFFSRCALYLYSETIINLTPPFCSLLLHIWCIWVHIACMELLRGRGYFTITCAFVNTYTYLYLSITRRELAKLIDYLIAK